MMSPQASPKQFQVVVPTTPQELWEHAGAIYFLASFLPAIPKDFWHNMLETLPSVLLFYAPASSREASTKNKTARVLGMAQCFMLGPLPGFSCVGEIHGVVRQDLRDYLKPRNYLSRALILALLTLLFETYHLDAILVNREDGTNYFLNGFLRLYPFQRLEAADNSDTFLLSADSFQRMKKQYEKKLD